MKNIFIYLILFLFIFKFSSQKEINSKRKNKVEENCKEFTFSPIEQNVKIIGRFYQDKNITWIVHSGSAIEFYLTGNKAEILLLGDSTIYSDIDLRPRFAIYINEELFLDSLMNELELNVKLLENEEQKKVKIKIMLLSENKYGGIGIKHINVYSCTNNNIIEPTEKKNISIEFIGDSMTCAYGVEGKDQNEHFKTSTENFSKSYAYLASQILNVDYSSVSYSGYGVVSGYSQGEKNSEEIVSLYYKNIGRHENYQGEWDFEKYKNDIIFVNLGANDYNYILTDQENRNDEFIQEYIKFIDLVKKCNPDSIIICTVGNIGNNEIFKLIESAVKIYNDEKVTTFELPPQYAEDGYGSDWHPSVASQERFSKIVADKLKEFIKN